VTAYVKGDRMDDDNAKTISGTFATREAADRVVEHLVQEHGIDRADIFVQAKGVANTSGVAPSGGDASRSDEGSDLDPALRGEIQVSADISRDEIAAAERTFREAGAAHLTMR
jgi:hypothetical protein